MLRTFMRTAFAHGGTDDPIRLSRGAAIFGNIFVGLHRRSAGERI